MYIDTYALGEAKADAATELACGCVVCMGKTSILRDRDFELSSASTLARGVVRSTIQVDSDEQLTGSITEGEEFDLYTISVVAGQTYSVALRGVGEDGLDDPLLALFDETGAFLDFDDDGGAGITSLLTFTATATGDYFLTAQAFLPNDLGDYTIDIWAQPETDQVPDTFAGAVEIEYGTTFGHIETSDDLDSYKVFLEAGKLYVFQLAGGADYNSDATELPPGELDTILALYAPDGTFIGFNDDIDFPTDISSGFSFVPQVSGEYYLDVFAFPDQTGGYTLDVEEVDPTLFDPLDSINWFSSNNIPTQDVAGVETAYVYFGDSDENFGQTNDAGDGPMVTIDWNDFEKQQVMVALEEFERILGIDYQITTDVNEATFRLLKTESELYGAYFFPQDPAFEESQGVGVFNVLSGGWTLPGQASLEEGGYSFSVILHEFGHAHGLAHPHDTGGGSDIMLGVTSPFGSLGLFNLNQGVHTVMSYNDAWQLHPDGPTPFTRANIDSGWSGQLSPFDIAVLQQRYGVVARETGDNVYRLGDANDQGTFYQTIWDSAGTDEIRYDGRRATQIDLTAATLDYTPTGGGVVSFVDDIWGGYTIANGVVIENATGGSGNDVLVGNAAANALTGNRGNDMLMGRDGNDMLAGGLGDDTLEGGAGDDMHDGGAGNDTMRGGAGNDTYRVDSATDQVIELAGEGTDTVSTNLSTYTLGDGVENLEFLLNTASTGTGNALNNIITGRDGNDTLSGLNGDDQLIGGRGNDNLNGGGGADILRGDRGADILIGNSGSDVMAGGLDADIFRFSAGHINNGAVDWILDFAVGSDKLDLPGSSGASIQITGVTRGFVQNTSANGTSLDNAAGAQDLILTIRNTGTGATERVVLLDSYAAGNAGQWSAYLATLGYTGGISDGGTVTI